MIGQQGRHESQLGVHPALLQPGGIHAQQASRTHHCDHHAGGGDDVGQTAFHQAVLGLESRPQGFLQLLSLAVIDEQPH